MKDNIYTDIKFFIKKLGNHGYVDYMNLLSDDLSYSSTGGEIMMKLNHHLLEIMKDKTMVGELIDKAKEIQNEIEKYII